jgi:mono/diheme cytochrome c family protein
MLKPRILRWGVPGLLAAALTAGYWLHGRRTSGGSSDQVPAAQASPVRGRELFGRNGCAVCHGEEGRGDGSIAQTLRPRPRNFRDLGAYKQGVGVDQIARTIETGIPGSSMPAYAHLSAAERRSIALFVQETQAQP